jgi:hypothetical protein
MDTQINNMNTFSFIKKSRPKLKIGDYFYYNINNKNYIGVVINTHFQKNILKENTAVICLFINYYFNDKKDIMVEDIYKTINNIDLLIPPMYMNKRGWTNGFFCNLGTINLEPIQNIINKCQFSARDGKGFYDINYQGTDEPNNDTRLIGSSGLYTYEGVEAQLQISLDLEFTSKAESWYDPFGYYKGIKNKYPSIELPYWFYKAKKRLNK